MPEHLLPPSPDFAPVSTPASEPDQDHPEGLRILSRSPHPYSRQNHELLEPSDRLVHQAAAVAVVTQKTGSSGFATPNEQPEFTKDSTPASDSGTEADDEHFLKGLPAPKARLHKGLRGKNESISGTSTPMLSPAILEEEGMRKTVSGYASGPTVTRDRRSAAERSVRRRKEVIRRLSEVLLLACQAGMVASNPDVQPFLRSNMREIIAMGWTLFVLVAAYPLRLIIWAYRQEKTPTKRLPVSLPASFDPAPLLYPLLVPLFVSLLVAKNVEGAILPNIVLGLCALPRPIVPGARYWETYSSSHWLISCIPVFVSNLLTLNVRDQVSREVLVLLYPLHQTLCLILQYLTTTSLLIAELQLLSVALINVLLLAHSPQAVILKALLWGGGIGLIISCGPVIHWGISLARVPKWRFKRVVPSHQAPTDDYLSRLAAVPASIFRFLRYIFAPQQANRLRNIAKAERAAVNDPFSDSGNSAAGTYHRAWGNSFPTQSSSASMRFNADDGEAGNQVELRPHSDNENKEGSVSFIEPLSARRHTLPALGSRSNSNKLSRSNSTTPSGRKKRSASSSVRAFFSLTQSQATARKWMYAAYVYACVLLVILGGIREYVGRFALSGREPVGWALGYLFGGLGAFRFEVVKANLESWICLPDLQSGEEPLTRSDGSVPALVVKLQQHVRRLFEEHLGTGAAGGANTRLALSAYWLGVIVIGLGVVLRLSPVCEVDTRRKVFHFMMVAMFLPTAYVDPTYVALALELVLAIFLLLDLLRASQLPPLSKPIAWFLTPYVDGRDLRGPVVISHIFLLIGCAIPLWLSLGSLGRLGEGALLGWEVPTREVSMVSGIVCVGLGDAAASLIGRRWGHRKWLWGGGKSVEGSVAFASAVFVGLMAANVWLRAGGWPITSSTADFDIITGWQSSSSSWVVIVLKTMVCASIASLTEAVLTGGNDNVVVPVVLWTCVKSIGL